MAEPNTRFEGAIPAAYDRYLGPLFFEPYAADLSARVATGEPVDVLEVACGSGIVTRALLRALPHARIVATDLNDAMIEHAQAMVPTSSRLSWRQADASALPFADASFDIVAMQFGIMFVPDKALALREARRVLRPGGTFIFNTWDDVETNPTSRTTREVIYRMFPDNPPTFYEVPFGFHDRSVIRSMLTEAGFRDIAIDTVRAEARSPTARDAATGLVTGTPVFTAFREAAVSDITPIVDALEDALAAEGGRAPFAVPMQAVVMTARA